MSTDERLGLAGPAQQLQLQRITHEVTLEDIAQLHDEKRSLREQLLSAERKIERLQRRLDRRDDTAGLVAKNATHLRSDLERCLDLLDKHGIKRPYLLSEDASLERTS